jgi:Domain of unknown function (DUF4157)
MKDRETSQTRISTLRRTNGVLQRKCACGQHTAAGGGCSACEKNKGLQRKSISGDLDNTVPHSIDDALRSAGEPLDESTRTFMERRFGHDFSNVRTHTDAKAEKSAKAINALAYTVGNNIVFARGEYAPHTLTGSRLLAHELTHVVRQHAGGANSIQAKPDMDQPATSFEREADLMAEVVTGSLGKGVGSSTLPYREATELADCVRIMGERSMDYCLEAVSHEKSRCVCGRSGIQNPLSDMSTFQSPGLSGLVGEVRLLSSVLRAAA